MHFDAYRVLSLALEMEVNARQQLIRTAVDNTSTQSRQGLFSV